jgi:hypothetical protein
LRELLVVVVVVVVVVGLWLDDLACRLYLW